MIEVRTRGGGALEKSRQKCSNAAQSLHSSFSEFRPFRTHNSCEKKKSNIFGQFLDIGLADFGFGLGLFG
jgi:hypothetical protein